MMERTILERTTLPAAHRRRPFHRRLASGSATLVPSIPSLPPASTADAVTLVSHQQTSATSSREEHACQNCLSLSIGTARGLVRRREERIRLTQAAGHLYQTEVSVCRSE